MGVIILALTLFSPVGAYADSEQSSPAVTPTTSTTSTEVPTSPSPTPSTSVESPSTPPPVSTPATPAPPPTVAVQPQPQQTPPPASAPQPQPKPEKPKYKYDEATGLWTNGTYAWDPNTGQTKPLNSPDYSFNPETNKWETKDWRYDPAEGKYVPNTVRVAPDSASGSGTRLGGGNSEFFNLYYNAGISNNFYSSSLSGNASVFGNTIGGNALSGNALTIANVFNMINSSIGLAGGSSIASFSSDIYGDVVGDLYVDPSALVNVQPAAGVDEMDSNLKVNVNTSSSVENNISLASRSGDASVSGNTKGGNATSGSADAVANIVNMLNSAISSGGSFIGLLNIYGNLNGDILLPEGILNQLLASNGGCVSVCSGNSNANVNLNDSQLINNNVNTTAQSGTATVAKNTSAGNATSGNGQTNVTILNLTGRNVVAANSLLVFVNVLGQWVGVIMDAPAGSTSAALGTGVTQDNSALAGKTDISADTNARINNNIDVHAQSGNADVSKNTEAGNATSGNASASVNLANITNSNFSLANWFGILFINVFGTWNGSFGVDTVAGNKPSTGASGEANGGGIAPRVFQFVPATGNSNGGMTLSSVNMDNATNARAVAAAMESVQDELTKQQPEPTVSGISTSNIEPSGKTVPDKNADFTLPMLGFAIGGSLIGGERLVSRRQRRK